MKELGKWTWLRVLVYGRSRPRLADALAKDLFPGTKGPLLQGLRATRYLFV